MSQFPSYFLKENGEFFTHCKVCQKELKDAIFFVEKAYQKNLNGKGFFVLFEFAICHKCRDEMAENISKESLMRMQKYMLSHRTDIEKNLLQKGINYCSIYGDKLTSDDAYHRMGIIQNNKLMSPPISMGYKAIEEYQELLSDQTKGFIDDFYNRYIDIPPSLARLFNNSQKTIFI